jgi:hypothetical protein
MSKWKEVRSYVNSNNIFTKKDMHLYFADDGIGYTHHQYILLLMNSGFVDSISRGKYKRLVKIPDDFTLRDLQSIAYDSNAKDVVIKRLIRREKLINL